MENYNWEGKFTYGQLKGNKLHTILKRENTILLHQCIYIYLLIEPIVKESVV